MLPPSVARRRGKWMAAGAGIVIVFGAEAPARAAGAEQDGEGTLDLEARIEGAMAWIERIAGFLLGVITLVVFTGAVMRYLFTMPIPDGFDISRLLLGCAVLWGLASATFRDSHIRMDLAWQFLPAGGRRALDLAANLVTLVAIAIFAWMLLSKVQDVYAANESTFDLRLPIWPFYALAWLGVAAALLSAAARFYLLALGRGAVRERAGE
jgi:TRAP-type C4-dicarboxylate transport system permease small subunit